MKPLACLCVVFAIGAAATPGHTGPERDEAARALFEQGVERFRSGDYESACPTLRRSLEQSDAKGPLLWLARCEDARGRAATALELWQRVRTELADKPDHRAEAITRIDALVPVVPRLRVQAPAGAAVRVDGKPALPGTDILVDPGRHEVVANLGGVDRRFSVELGPAERREVRVGPVSRGARRDDDGPDALFAAGLVAGAVGLAGATLFAVTGPLVLSGEAELDELCPDRSRCAAPEAEAVADRTRALGIANIVGLVVGGAGLGVGITLLLLSGGEEPETGGRASLSLSSDGLAVHGRF
jgi:hypothetical protein